jgi:hypothetical protein
MPHEFVVKKCGALLGFPLFQDVPHAVRTDPSDFEITTWDRAKVKRRGVGG